MRRATKRTLQVLVSLLLVLGLLLWFLGPYITAMVVAASVVQLMVVLLVVGPLFPRSRPRDDLTHQTTHEEIR